MHHFLLALILLGILLFLLFPWRLAFPLFVGVFAIFVVAFLLVGRKQSIRLVGAPIRPMVGSRAIVVKAGKTDGEVRWQGEIWHAISAQPLAPGDEVIIEEVEGLTLRVRVSEARDQKDL
jgi:membrane protein implicated in regulation of membrane protease activity